MNISSVGDGWERLYVQVANQPPKAFGWKVYKAFELQEWVWGWVIGQLSFPAGFTQQGATTLPHPTQVFLTYRDSPAAGCSLSMPHPTLVTLTCVAPVPALATYTM